MGSSSGLMLRGLQWIIRGIQFCCCALVLALFSYFLATLAHRGSSIQTWIRAVEGISGIGLIYAALGLLLVCCLAGHLLTSSIMILLDLCLVGAFIYVASANRVGASNCNGRPDTALGAGNSTDKPNNENPSYGTACRMQSACFAVSIVAIVMFIISALLEMALIRHRRKERRFGPSPANNYTSGYGKRRGLFGLFGRREPAETSNPNALPSHPGPDDLRTSYNTETTAVGHEPTTYNKYKYDGQTAYPETGAANTHTGYPETGTATGHTQPAGFRY
ncbi:hypothetical protein GGR54DRAFT_599489 [Hypoxylon sp. NC1633]|nr:hypothetical protein GGR54DRAFT_599489 [Hypoxylon sp. NC1633]